MQNSDDLYQSIIGFGSLLSQRSALSSFPNLKNFRIGRLCNWRRVFAHAPAIFAVRGIARFDTKEMSSLSIEECEGEELIVTLFEIPINELPSFYEREEEFRIVKAQAESLAGQLERNLALVCAAWNDEDYKRERCNNSEEEFQKRYGRYGITKIWRNDILPCRIYLRHCILAATKQGDLVLNNFLDHTYIADRKTTIREYINKNPTILTEEPPEELKYKYSG